MSKKLLKKILIATINVIKQNDFLKEYEEYKYFDTPLGLRKLSKEGLVKEYISYMEKMDIVLSSGNMPVLKKTIPQPSEALRKFKDKFKFI